MTSRWLVRLFLCCTSCCRSGPPGRSARRWIWLGRWAVRVASPGYDHATHAAEGAGDAAEQVQRGACRHAAVGGDRRLAVRAGGTGAIRRAGGRSGGGRCGRSRWTSRSRPPRRRATTSITRFMPGPASFRRAAPTTRPIRFRWRKHSFPARGPLPAAVDSRPLELVSPDCPGLRRYPVRQAVVQVFGKKPLVMPLGWEGTSAAQPGFAERVQRDAGRTRSASSCIRRGPRGMWAPSWPSSRCGCPMPGRCGWISLGPCRRRATATV